MPIIAILIIALQIFFAAHAVRNGKDPIWLWLIILAPGLGCAIYFVTQFGPDAANSRTAKRAKNTLIRAVDPQRELHKRKEILEISNTVENRLALAEECIEAAMFIEGIQLLNECLVGLHETDPGIMEALASAQFQNGEPEKSAATLTALIEANPDYKSPDGHLLYARSLEAQQKHDEAKREYEVLRQSFPGEEARVRYGQMLKELGENDKAAELFQEALLRGKRAPKHYRKKEKQWLSIAERG